MQTPRHKGFTLIELSVVLVIIGLLTGGLLLAQQMVRSANVQTIVTDVAMYQDAISQFKQKYSALPGDMNNAQTYWGVNPNCATGGLGTGTQTCNGDGDGHIQRAVSAPPYEQFYMWQHLALSGLITGSYTGAFIPTAVTPVYYCAPGINCAGGRVNSQQAYFLSYSGGRWSALATIWWDQPASHYLVIGTNNNRNDSANMPGYPLLTTSEAYALDSKVDDGLPGLGVWKTFENGVGGNIPNCVVTSGTTTKPTDASMASEATSVYYVGYTKGPACSFLVDMKF